MTAIAEKDVPRIMQPACAPDAMQHTRKTIREKMAALTAQGVCQVAEEKARKDILQKERGEEKIIRDK